MSQSHHKRKILYLGFCLLICWGCYPTLKTNMVCYREDCIEVEVASTPESLVQGLQYRMDLEENQGMLFIFEKSGRHSFWMKNTLIPLDIIWLDENKHVVHIEHNLQPCIGDFCPSYVPRWDALYVLEVNAGKVSQWRLSLGEKLTIHLKSIDYTTSDS